MAGAAVQTTFSGLSREIEAAVRGAIPTDTRPLINQWSVYLGAAAKKRFATATSPDGQPWLPLRLGRPRGGDRPLRDRGLLMASVTGQGAGSVQRLTDTSVEQGTNLEYAAIHQHGGIIRPKKAKALAIPVSREAYGKRPRSFGDRLALVWTKGNNKGWLIERKGKGKREKTLLHYLLVPQVTIPARPFIGVNEEDADKLALMAADFFGVGR